MSTGLGPVVLVVDDDRELVDLLAFALERAGFQVLQAYDSPTALRLIEQQLPDAILLDINMGPWNGVDVLKTLRARRDERGNMVVVMLTGLTDEDDKVRALELGADDYVTKPFSHRELVARLRAQLRRPDQEWALPSVPASGTRGTTVLHIGPITLDPAKRVVTKDRQLLSLTPTEFRVLHYLMANAGIVVQTRALLRHVWGVDDSSLRETVRVTMHRLRRKIETDPANPRLLHTVPGVGIMLSTGEHTGEDVDRGVDQRAG
jgi:two-component system response regulator VicR